MSKGATGQASGDGAEGNPPAELAGRWRRTAILKRDVFSTLERGWYETDAGAVEGVLRRIDAVPWWSRLLAAHFLRREARALKIVGGLGTTPRLLFGGPTAIIRSWVPGLPLHLGRPLGDRRFFAEAARALRAIHALKLTHNDLAKQQNWLLGTDGRPYVTDFQLAIVFRRRSRLFRLAAHDDIRHMLKHKRTYVPDALTPTERRILAHKMIFNRIWMSSGKRVYLFMTRRLFRFTDREGAGPRLVRDAPVLAAALKAHPAVRDAVIVAYPDRRSGTGLYAFAEAADGIAEIPLRQHLAARLPEVRAPELLQVVGALPRDKEGAVRTEILQVIAINQTDLLPGLIRGEEERRLVAAIADRRANLGDRVSW